MNLPFGDKTFSTLAQQVTSRSAVNPCLWACLVISLPLFGFASYTTGIKAFCYFIIALLPVATFIFSYIYLLVNNPKYLRSEEYQLKAEALNIFGDKDNPLNANADNIISVVAITNPALPALQPPEKTT